MIPFCYHKHMTLTEFVLIERGNAARLARNIGVLAPEISRWASGKRSVPVKWCLPIEQATGEQVTRKELRPNDWMRYWPELAQDAAAAVDEREAA